MIERLEKKHSFKITKERWRVRREEAEKDKFLREDKRRMRGGGGGGRSSHHHHTKGSRMSQNDPARFAFGDLTRTKEGVMDVAMREKLGRIRRVRDQFLDHHRHLMLPLLPHEEGDDNFFLRLDRERVIEQMGAQKEMGVIPDPPPLPPPQINNNGETWLQANHQMEAEDHVGVGGMMMTTHLEENERSSSSSSSVISDSSHLYPLHLFAPDVYEINSHHVTCSIQKVHLSSSLASRNDSHHIEGGEQEEIIWSLCGEELDQFQSPFPDLSPSIDLHSHHLVISSEQHHHHHPSLDGFQVVCPGVKVTGYTPHSLLRDKSGGSSSHTVVSSSSSYSSSSSSPPTIQLDNIYFLEKFVSQIPTSPSSSSSSSVIHTTPPPPQKVCICAVRNEESGQYLPLSQVDLKKIFKPYSRRSVTPVSNRLLISFQCPSSSSSSSMDMNEPTEIIFSREFLPSFIYQDIYISAVQYGLSRNPHLISKVNPTELALSIIPTKVRFVPPSPRMSHESTVEKNKEHVVDGNGVADGFGGGGGMAEVYSIRHKNVKLRKQPKGLRGITLHDYQIVGFSWMVHMFQNGLSFILGDQMGTGKTIQAIAFLSYLKKSLNQPGPHLILCPLSVLAHWMSEIEKFCPSLVALRFHGTQNERNRMKSQEMKDSKNFDIVVTTYEVALNEFNYLRKKFVWTTLIVDEGHRLKNHKSKLSSNLRVLPCISRIILTGTPLQNNLSELWSLFRFMLPDVFNPKTREIFSRGFDISTNEFSSDVMSKVRDLLSLFMLRRTKKDLSFPLPPKYDTTIILPLSKDQQRWYRRMMLSSLDNTELIDIFEKKMDEEDEVEILLNNCKEEVDDGDGSEENGRRSASVSSSLRPSSSFMGDNSWQTMMNMILQLRKICNHPFLLQNPLQVPIETYQTQDSKEKDQEGSGDMMMRDGTEGEKEASSIPSILSDPRMNFYYSHMISSSAKLSLMDKMLPRLRDGGHRVLIFSQFTSMLDILCDYCEYREFDFVRLDGGTNRVKRKYDVKLFNAKQSNKFLFLISTRAGGLGLNLASADTVILYDSDWNPQVDLQAMERAHRIGQTKPVFVYRLICRGTIEERIVSRAQKKLFLSAIIIESKKTQDDSDEEEEEENPADNSLDGSLSKKKRKRNGEGSHQKENDFDIYSALGVSDSSERDKTSKTSSITSKNELASLLQYGANAALLDNEHELTQDEVDSILSKQIVSLLSSSSSSYELTSKIDGNESKTSTNVMSGVAIMERFSNLQEMNVGDVLNALSSLSNEENDEEKEEENDNEGKSNQESLIDHFLKGRSWVSPRDSIYPELPLLPSSEPHNLEIFPVLERRKSVSRFVTIKRGGEYYTVLKEELENESSSSSSSSSSGEDDSDSEDTHEKTRKKKKISSTSAQVTSRTSNISGRAKLWNHKSHCSVCGHRTIPQPHGTRIACSFCPHVLHEKCADEIFINRYSSNFICPMHYCGECGKSTSDGGGMLFRCLSCFLSYCDDCIPPFTFEIDGYEDYFESKSLEDVEEENMLFCKAVKVEERNLEFERLGYKVDQAYWITCPHCIFANKIYENDDAIVTDERRRNIHPSLSNDQEEDENMGDENGGGGNKGEGEEGEEDNDDTDDTDDYDYLDFYWRNWAGGYAGRLPDGIVAGGESEEDEEEEEDEDEGEEGEKIDADAEEEEGEKMDDEEEEDEDEDEEEEGEKEDEEDEEEEGEKMDEDADAEEEEVEEEDDEEDDEVEVEEEEDDQEFEEDDSKSEISDTP